VTKPGIFRAATGLFAAQGCSYTETRWTGGGVGLHCEEARL